MKKFKKDDRVQYDGKDALVYFKGADTGTVIGYHEDGSVMVHLDKADARQDIDAKHLTAI